MYFNSFVTKIGQTPNKVNKIEYFWPINDECLIHAQLSLNFFQTKDLCSAVRKGLP